MLKLSNINPVARAVGTMGAIAAIVGGVTFAAFQSNTVALDPNTLTSASAALQIGSNAEAFSGQVAGINSDMVPGTPTAPFTFYLKNNGEIPLNVSAHIPTVFTSGIDPTKVTLAFDCGGGPVSFKLSEWAAGSAVIPGGALAAGQTWTCSETATLDASATGSGDEAVQAFRVEFVGNQ
jgi:hypothetical protein